MKFTINLGVVCLVPLCIYGAFFGKAQAQPAPGITIQQPYALPAQIGGTGSPAKTGYTETGRWVAWTYTRNEREHLYTVCWLYNHQTSLPETSHLKTSIATARLLLKANLNTNCSADPRMQPMVRAAMEAFRQP